MVPSPAQHSNSNTRCRWAYGDYADAQHAVDYLSDRGFPVQHIAINGTGLKSVERVTGRLTRGKLAAAGALSGLWMGRVVATNYEVVVEHSFAAQARLLLRRNAVDVAVDVLETFGNARAALVAPEP